MQTITDFIDYFSTKICNYRKDNSVVYNLDDLRQQAAMLILEFYDKATSEDSSNPVGYLSKTIFNRLKTYRYKNRPLFYPSAFINLKEADHLDIEYGTPSGICESNVDYLDCKMDIEDFCERYDAIGIIPLKIQGYSVKEISEILGLDYIKLMRYNKVLKDKLIAFLEK